MLTLDCDAGQTLQWFWCGNGWERVWQLTGLTSPASYILLVVSTCPRLIDHVACSRRSGYQRLHQLSAQPRLPLAYPSQRLPLAQVQLWAAPGVLVTLRLPRLEQPAPRLLAPTRRHLEHLHRLEQVT